VAETLGKRIRRKREEKSLGLREMARSLDISPTYLSRVETDEEKNPPTEKMLESIARLLEDDADELMYLAGRVPSDLSEMIKRDRTLPQFLRTARQHGLTGEALNNLLEKDKKK
jgi:transcriptional regulator with XRE-family HTH domain